jgi:hypothetical protein
MFDSLQFPELDFYLPSAQDLDTLLVSNID